MIEPKDNWERNIEALEKAQQHFRDLKRVLVDEHETLRPGQNLENILKLDLPGALFQMVQSNQVAPYALLVDVLARQVEFNQTVIAMLTDLDHRKKED